jgi:hypothetical protein
MERSKWIVHGGRNMKLFNPLSVILAVTPQSPYTEARQTYQQQQQVKKPVAVTQVGTGSGYQQPRPSTPAVVGATPVTAQVQPQTPAKQVEVLKEEADKQKLILRKKMFKNLLLTSIILVVIGIVLAIALLPLTTHTPEEVEDATEDRTPEELKGKSWTMLGTIETKEELDIDGEKIYSYEFEDTDLKFKSSEDIGDKGDDVVITVQNTELEPLEASNPENVFVYYLPGMILIIIGAVHLVIAILLKLKMDRE